MRAVCHICPANSFCPGRRQNDHMPGQAFTCPADSDTREKTQQIDCTCKPGYTGGKVTDLGSQCKICSVASYCPDGFTEVPCMPLQTSPPGSTAPSQCVCVEGYELVGGKCVTSCVAQPGNWCEGTEPADAPVLTERPCPKGFYCPGGRGAVKSECLPAAGFFCPEHWATSSGSACPANSYCEGGAPGYKVSACPDNSDTRALSAQSTCQCVAGFVGGAVAATGSCSPCVNNSYCPDGILQLSCGLMAASPAGSSSASQCFCVTGYEDVGGSCVTTCVAQPGEYCVGSRPPDAPVLTAASTPVGYYGAGGRGADKAPCTAVMGHYCNIGSAQPFGAVCPVRIPARKLVPRDRAGLCPCSDQGAAQVWVVP